MGAEKHDAWADVRLGDWNIERASLELKPDDMLFHGKPYQVPISSKPTFKSELERLFDLKVLKKCNDSSWAFPSFGIPKKMGT